MHLRALEQFLMSGDEKFVKKLVCLSEASLQVLEFFIETSF